MTAVACGYVSTGGVCKGGAVVKKSRLIFRHRTNELRVPHTPHMPYSSKATIDKRKPLPNAPEVKNEKKMASQSGIHAGRW